MKNVDSYIFLGNTRENATDFVEKNKEAAVGAPYEIPAELGAVIVARLSKNETDGKFQFRFQVVGQEMSNFELWFSKKEPWAIYATLGAVALVIVLIFIWFCVCCA